MNSPRHILITGASSGLGAALAMQYAAPGVVLGLMGRDQARLSGVAARATAAGATCVCGGVDVVEAAAMARWIEDFDTQYPVDLVVANAGISAGSGVDNAGETPAQAQHIFSVNVQGVLHTVGPLLPRMTARKRGQVVLISSLAGLRGLPTAPAYSASKGALRLYAEGLRPALAPWGVSVSVVSPGFIKTPMTDVNTFPMPFLMDPAEAARHIRRGLTRRKAHIVFPFRLYLFVSLLAHLPATWGDVVLKRLPGKKAADSPL